MRNERRWKLVALLGVGMAIGVTMVATPVGAHVANWTHNWNTHIKPRTDARYYTKTLSNERYLRTSGNLPAGKTLRGVYWALGDHGVGEGQHIASSEISFQVPLASAPTTHYIGTGDPVPTGCSGSAASPGAAPGHLCIFQLSGYNSSGATISSPDDSSSSTRFGAVVLIFSSAEGRFSNGGTWAVTAPMPTARPAPADTAGPRSRGS